MEPPGSTQGGGVVNMTRAMEALSPWLNHPRRTIVQVEALVVTAAVLLLLQLILGSCKRRWHNSIVTFALLACNKLMFPLVFYTLSTMQSSPIKNSSYPVWAICLVMAAVGTTAVQEYDFCGTFYSKYMQVVVDFGKYGFYFVMFTGLLSPNAPLSFSLSPNASSRCVTLLSGAVLFTACLESLGLALLGYSKNHHHSIIVTERVQERADGNLGDSDPETMKAYNYVVLRRPIVYIFGYSDQSITTEHIWHCCGHSGDDKALQDFCLSYALYQQLLTRRYFGEICPEANLQKDRYFFFEKVLPFEADFRRAFGIIEIELGFCYDFFFTKYNYTFVSMASRIPLVPVVVSLKIILILTVGLYAFRKSIVLETTRPIIEVHITYTDYMITLLVLSIAFTVELLQVAFYLASDWVQVALACTYATKNCNAGKKFIGKVIGFLRKVIISGALRSKMYQLSLISRQKHSVEVSDIVKKAIARSLLTTDGNLTNGQTSLRRNLNQMFEEYSWTLKDHCQLEVMLIWHIATEYCDMSSDDDHAANGVTGEDDRGVAVSLSRYCAYLIVFAPELLPYPKVDIAMWTVKLTEEVEKLFGLPIPRGGYRYSPSESCNIMKNLEGTEDGGSPTTMVFTKGVRLGTQLKRSMPDGAQRWKVMADFWAETMIYVAPSHSTTTQHMQHLENGGEFLTHIWALLFHAGILNLNRDKDQGPQAGFQAMQGANRAFAGPSQAEMV